MARRKVLNTETKETKLIDIKTKQFIEKTAKPVVCERIRYYRKKQHIDQKAFAASMGISATSVHNWEMGIYRPDVELLPKICEELHISLYQLYNIDDPSGEGMTTTERKALHGYRELTPEHQIAVRTLINSLIAAQNPKPIPEIAKLRRFDQRLAAGIGDPSEFEDTGTVLYAYATPLIKRADYIFYINGDSMEPDYTNGEQVLVKANSGANLLAPGEVGAFMVNNELYIKEYFPDGLHSLNRKYPVMKFVNSDKVTLIGKVVGKFEDTDIVDEEVLADFKELHPDFV